MVTFLPHWPASQWGFYLHSAKRKSVAKILTYIYITLTYINIFTKKLANKLACREGKCVFCPIKNEHNAQIIR